MKNQEDKPASFIGKLCNILRSKQHAKVIYWDTEHRGIRILNQKKLEETILPKYYRHNRFASFVRQLNMYDFHKVHLGDHKSVFLHSEFDPKKKQNIHLIRRKVTFADQANSSENNPSRGGTGVKLQEVELSLNLKDNHDKENISQEEKGSQHINFMKSSKKLFRNSIHNLLSQRDKGKFEEKEQKEECLTVDQVLDEILAKLLPQNLTVDGLKIRIKQLKKERKFKKYLRKSTFLSRVYVGLGLEYYDQSDKLSQLSIEDQLLFNTRRSLTQKSLKLLQSGPLCYKRDTIGQLMTI